MTRQDQFDRIIASLHEAMLDDTRWRETSALIDDACGITGTHLVLVGGDPHDNPQWLFDKPYWRGELRADLARDYAENYFPSDERIPRLLRLPDRRVVRVTDIYTERELKLSPTFNELLRRAGARDGLNIRMDGPVGIHICWALANPTTSGGWSSEQIEMIERLLPHIRQFIRVRQALLGAHALGASLSGLLDNMMIGVVCLDWRGMIVQANCRARSILRHNDGLVDRGGFLRAHVAADDRQLRSLLAHAVPRSGAQAAGGSMTVARSRALPRFVLHVTPVDVHDAGFGIGQVAALVLIVDPTAKPRIDPERVAATLGLTRAESQVAAALAEGSTMREIAADKHRAESTVRELVKRIHAKLGVSRRADLVRMVLSVVAVPDLGAASPDAGIRA